MNNIESIAAVDGLDAIFVGSNDLAASLGKIGQFEDSEVVAAIERVTAAAQNNDLALGFFGVDSASVSTWIDRGYTLICAGVDAIFVTQGAKRIVDTLKNTR